MRICIVHLIEILDIDCLLGHVSGVRSTLHIDRLSLTIASLEVAKTTVVCPAVAEHVQDVSIASVTLCWILLLGRSIER